MSNPIKEKIFWGKEYGKVYPKLEEAGPYKELISQCKKFVGPDIRGRWLDIGCGSGAIIELLWRVSGGRLEQLFALDFSEEMLEHARRKISKLSPAPEPDQIILERHDLSFRLPYGNGYFDGAVSNLVLPYVINHEGREGREALKAVLAETHRVLAPGGIFVWSSPIKGVNFWKVFLASWRDILNPKELVNLYYGPAILKHTLEIQKKGKNNIYNFLTTTELTEILSGIGFAEIEMCLSLAKQAIVIKAVKQYA